ncbi:MAG: DUF933 domain-containing protein, partial [Pseudomonadota bacterium]
PGLGMVKVADPRLDFLADYHKPKKVTPVHVEYLDVAGITGEGKQGRSLGDKFLSVIRPLDALVTCIRCFDSMSSGKPSPLADYKTIEEEMILSDLSSVEKRLERVTKDLSRGRKELAEEFELLTKASELLNKAKPLRLLEKVSANDKMRGFAFLSAKPQLILLNAGDNKKPEEITSVMREFSEYLQDQPHVGLDWLYADTEAELAGLTPDEASEFLEEMSLEEGAKERIIKRSFELLNLIVFLTAGEPEVRAWSIVKGSTAVKAAGTIHSDIERGFIRAEVVSFEDFNAAGSMAAAQKAGRVRLEGRDYVVKDGDIMLFRFNV